MKISSKNSQIRQSSKTIEVSNSHEKEIEDEESKTPHFYEKAEENKGQNFLDLQHVSESHSRNKFSPKSKIDSFPLQLSNIKSSGYYSDGTESLRYYELHSTIEREQRGLSQNVIDSGTQGIQNLPQVSPTFKIFAFIRGVLQEYQLRISKEDLHSIVNSLRKSNSRNGILSEIQSLRSSLEMFHQKFKDPTEASTRRDQQPSPELIRMEDGTVLTVEQNPQTRDKTLKVIRSSHQGKNLMAVQSSLDEVAEDEEQVIEWKEYRQHLVEFGNDILLVHYSEKMLEKVIERSINDPEANQLNTSGPHCIFKRMEENIRCVNNYNNRETNDVLWVNMQIFMKLIERQSILARKVIETSLRYFKLAKKEDLEAREYHLSGLLFNDMSITMNLFENYADAFLRLRSDSGNYTFLHSFFENHFCNKFGHKFTPEYVHREARKWIGGIIFKPQMIEYLLDCVQDQLSGYYIMQKKLSYLRLICQRQLSELIPLLSMNFESVDGLIAEAEKRYLNKKKEMK